MKIMRPIQALKSVMFGMTMAFISIGAMPILVIKSFTETFIP